MINNETDYNNNEEDIDMESLESKSANGRKSEIIERIWRVFKNKILFKTIFNYLNCKYHSYDDINDIDWLLKVVISIYYGVIKNGWLRIIQHLFYDQQYRRVLTKKLSSNNSIYTQTELSLLLRHAISWDQFYIAEFFVDQMGLK
ncbi:hypothetical protein ACTFIT_002625 [Dictyostelium discoideum]